MKLDFNNEKPIFLQIAEEIEDAIFTGSFKEEGGEEAHHPDAL